MKLPDVNVLLYAVNRDCPQHATAVHWLEDAFNSPGGVGLPWPVLLGFLRIATLRRVLPQPLPLDTALAVMDEWLAHPRARILLPSRGHAALLARLLLGAGRGGNLTSDANLAAIAIAHGATLGSFDADFQDFSGLDFQYLATPTVHEPPPV